MTYAVLIGFDPETKNYYATAPDFGDDVVGIGTTESEASFRFRNALAAYIAFKAEKGEMPPEPRHSAVMIDVGSLAG